MAPKYFVPIVYLHLLAGTGLTFLSSRHPLAVGFFYELALLVVVFGALFALFAMTPGPMKYLVAALFCAALGQTMAAQVQSLEHRNLIGQTLIATLGIFAAMSAVGFLDNQNLLGFGGYLLAALVGLLIARIVYSFVPSESTSKRSLYSMLSWIGAGLFSIYVAYDTQRLKEDMKRKTSPDYVMSSMGLYLDFLNLFQNIGNLK